MALVVVVLQGGYAGTGAVTVIIIIVML